MSAPDQVLFDKIKQLPRSAWPRSRISSISCVPARMSSVTHAAVKVSEASFAQVWNNDEDAACDRM